MSLPRTRKSTARQQTAPAQAYSSSVNRNATAKSLAPLQPEIAPDESDEPTLLRALEHGHLTPQQLKRLKRSSLLDPDRVPQHELELLKEDLLQALNKPLLFQARRHHYELKPARLFQQLEQRLATAPAGKVPRDLLHNFKRNGAVHRQLFEWAPLETVRSVMGSVHHQIFVRGRSAQSERPRPQALLALVDLQNALIHSAWQPYTQCTCAQLVYRLEVLVNAVLQRVIVRGARRALFVMEWSEAPRFQYVVCMDVREATQKKRKGVVVEEMEVEGVEEKTVELTRMDLLDDLAPVAENEHSALRRLLHDGHASYVFHAFVRRDDDPL